uniref:Molybdenum cofactor sulfurase n=1 Tax=Kalanchoe fedtschenkoi TaxID=63787 RepID=A0A7N0V3V7_KALFE
MNSPCIREAAEALPCRGCFPASLLASPGASTPDRAAGVFSSYWHDALASTLHPRFDFTNHESLPSLEASFGKFLAAFPQYSQTEAADVIRAEEYHHLADRRRVCLDYIGFGLYSYHQMRTCLQAGAALSSSSFPPFPLFEVSYKDGCGGSESESMIRTRLMEFMNVSESEYSMAFTANHSSALEALAERYPFKGHRTLLTAYDCEHEAVDRMVERAMRRGAKIRTAKFTWPNLGVVSARFRKALERKRRGLLVFPLQSQMSGTRYSYQWMSLAQERGWHVALDASALGAKEMDTLGLSIFRPDFLICSAYAVFGDNPSGFGCLFVKKSTAPILSDSSTATITLEGSSSSSSSAKLESKSKLASPLEFRGLDHADTLGLIRISSRTRYLANWLVNALLSLVHPSTEARLPLVRIYGPGILFDRGSSVAFNVFDWKGEKISPALVQKLADRNNISLSCGVLKQISFADKSEEARVRRAEKMPEGQPRVSVVSAVVGFLTDFADVYALWVFVSRFLDADFVEKERWRYVALNQKTIEV